jgi:hypothetical protein
MKLFTFVALACTPPPVGRRRWTLRLLAAKLVGLRYVDIRSFKKVYGSEQSRNSLVKMAVDIPVRDTPTSGMCPIIARILVRFLSVPKPAVGQSRRLARHRHRPNHARQRTRIAYSRSGHPPL